MSVSVMKKNIDNLPKRIAKRIIMDVGGTGQPPIYGYQYFTAGIDGYLSVIDKEYLSDFILDGGSAFKLVVGAYGGGKTHFLYSVQGLAWAKNYVTSYIELKSEATPLYNLESVYKAIAINLLYPQSADELLKGLDKGIEAIINLWYLETSKKFVNKSPEETELIIKDILSSLGPYESTSYLNAVKQAFIAKHNGDEESFNVIIQWLKGEKPAASDLKKFQINEKLDKLSAFKFIRCLVRWLNDIGFIGLIILMDEAEHDPTFTKRQKQALLSNLRDLIDTCSKGTLNGSMVFYAVPHVAFFSGSVGIYEALNQRLSTFFEVPLNPTGVKIILDNAGNNPEELFKEIGFNLAAIYEKAYDYSLDPTELDERIQRVALISKKQRFGTAGPKRWFVQEIIRNFEDMRNSPIPDKNGVKSCQTP